LGRGSLGAIVGPGRSGTTWAGSIVNSCPDVIYRFEPFHRMAPVDREFREWFEKLKNQAVRPSDLAQLYELLRAAHPLVDKAPFFPRKSYRGATLGREVIWPVARMVKPASCLYRGAYTPAAGPPLVFKEVTFIKPVKNLVDHLPIPIVYITRHPCATVMSEIRGQERVNRIARERRLRELLLEHAPSLLEEFADIVAGSDTVRRVALLWRCEVETCAALVGASSHGMLLTYEQLASDAYGESERMLRHFGLSFSEETRRYLDALHHETPGGGKGPRRTGWGKSYFSVYRNPQHEKDAWKRRISSEDQRKIEGVVQGSPQIERLASLGRWW
jgi:hypothetical protein